MALLKSRFRRIGITGTTRAGKTVFLLSLISQLKDNPEFRLQLDSLEYGYRSVKKRYKIKRFKEVELGKGNPVFPYLHLRDMLSNTEQWPQKTTDSSFFRCSFIVETENDDSWDWNNEHELEFYDFPGERTADAPMMGKSYRQWSEEMFSEFRRDSKRSLVQGFLSSLDSAKEGQPPEPARLIESYKVALAALILKFQPLVSPSTFLVDVDGNEAPWKNNAEELAEGRYAGLKDAEFAPLPEDAFTKWPSVVQAFEQAYTTYQDKVVKPFMDNLKSCHHLIFLADIADIADILGSGPAKLHDTQIILQGVLENIVIGRGWGSKAYDNSVGWLFGHKLEAVHKVAFVAAKADKIHELDQDRLKVLLRRMTESKFRNAAVGDCDYFTCKAVISASPSADHPEKRLLIGSPINQKEQVCEVPVPELPDDWPIDWKVAKYHFADFHPRIPRVHGMPPRQAGLAEILAYFIND